MKLERHDMLPVILPGRPRQGGRFVQDTRITAEVWLAYGRNESGPTDLLFNPEKEESPSQIVKSIHERLPRARIDSAFNETEAVARLTLSQLLEAVLPTTHWWCELWGESDPSLDWAEVRAVVRPDDNDTGVLPPDLLWFVRIVALLAWAKGKKTLPKNGPSRGALTKALRNVLEPVFDAPREKHIYRVNLNRVAVAAMKQSVPTVKADAAIRLFEISCQRIRWAILDSGIHAGHEAFLDEGDEPWGERTRVKRTFDFRRLRDIFRAARAGEHEELTPEDAQHLQRAIDRGAAIDWSLLEPLLRVRHDESYEPPAYPHGTEVAAVLGGDLETKRKGRIRGVCPDIELWDLRVLDENGEGNEFDILAALQFLRFKNAQRGTYVVHGVNLSLSLEHDVLAYGCGHTPVCREASRLVGSGVVVVAAAGNNGYVEKDRTMSGIAAYRESSITDPGNAPDVLTVGSTHRIHPHTYGVSYFSSRGPTGDGRVKPDLVAPGEKLEVPSLSGFSNVNGTSLAAPHVSGAAALLMARHRELIGDPARVKRALCETATDLGRDRYVQGFGLVDVLRAIQSL